MRVRKSAFGAVAALMAAALVLTACGDDDDDDDAGGGDSGGTQLTGAPIEIGLSNTENSPAGNYVDTRKGYEAAVQYINEELGGVNGRPIALETCTTNGSPETAIACANKFVEGNKVAVMPGIDLSAPGAIPIYTQAGMPYVGGLPVSAEELTAPTAFSFTGAAAGALAGSAAYGAQTLQAKSAIYMSVDVPQAAAAVDGFMKPVFAKLGVTDVDTVLESATAADYTPAVTRANSDDPDVIFLGYSGPTCVKVMQAVAQVNVPRDKLVYVAECANKEQIDAGNGGGDGAIYQTVFVNIDGDEPNAVLFREKMAQYSDAAAGVSSATGFNSMMNMYNILKKLPADGINRESIIAALKATNNEPGFLSHAYTCNGQQFPGLTAVCDANARFLKYENGEFSETNNDWVNGAAVLLGP